MLDDDGFFGPWQYPLWILWLVLGLLALLLVVAWAVFVHRFSARRLPPAERARLRERPADPAEVRARYEQLIDEVERAWRDGRLGDRAVHGRLSLLVRFHAHELDGVDAHVMTLEDLKEARLPQLSGPVEQWYPPAFRAGASSDPGRAIATAREVVRSWR